MSTTSRRSFFAVRCSTSDWRNAFGFDGAAGRSALQTAVQSRKVSGGLLPSDQTQAAHRTGDDGADRRS
jgi:hypothetical protein